MTIEFSGDNGFDPYEIREGTTIALTSLVMEDTERPSWASQFRMVAMVMSLRSTCNRAHVGAVAVKDHRILATGYNGSLPGEDHCDDMGHLMENGHCIRTIHAERNMVANAARQGVSLDGSTIYIYSSRGTEPLCRECQKVVRQAGVIEEIWT